MGKLLVKPLTFFAARWRVWSPPVVFAIIIFLGAILLSQGRNSVSFIYRIF